MIDDLDTLTITIGDETVAYHIAETSAPKAYDGFGTMTVATYPSNGRNFRIVLIRKEHFRWQNGRYNSGMFYATKPQGFDVKDVAALLWARLNKEMEE